ncbi:MAG: bifunctional hydroxymethylpyrimidine kinase/phosphomethylpyrimidine kinase [Filomicrobium sp.]|nr:bifunctional hydroxymethylpyrimidine kinase/phosphomethylpyrimidine kinase [Filomicrobium sp.]
MDHAKTPAVALTIAGSDSSGGAGIQADLKTFTVLGVYGASAITALTAQNTVGVRGVHTTPVEFLKAQIAAVLDDLKVNASKIGMLANAEIIKTVAAAIETYRLHPIVLDPVMVATSGDRLLAADAIAALREELIPRVDLLTPNLIEAADLLQEQPVEDIHAVEDQARRLLKLGCGAVLIKGGHGSGDVAIDLLVDKAGCQIFERPRLITQNTHGTGCTLSAAITAYLAMGQDLRSAVGCAKEFVWHALESATQQKLGHGSGPLDHMHALGTRTCM